MSLLRFALVPLVLLSILIISANPINNLRAKADDSVNISLLHPSVTSYYGPDETDRYIQSLQSNNLKNSLKLNSETKTLAFRFTLRIVNYASIAGTDKEVSVEICADIADSPCASSQLIAYKLVNLRFPACGIGSNCSEIQQNVDVEIDEAGVQRLLLERLSQTNSIPLKISVNADRAIEELNYADNTYYNQTGIQKLNLIGVIKSDSNDYVDLTGAKATIYYSCEFGHRYLSGSLSTVVIKNIAFFQFIPFDGYGPYLGNNSNIQYFNNCQIESNSNISVGDQVLAIFDSINSNGGTINCCTTQERIQFKLISAKIVSIQINTEDSVDVGGESVVLPSQINSGEISIQNTLTNHIMRTQIYNGLAIFTSLKFPDLLADPPLKLLRTNAISTGNIGFSDGFVNVHYAWPYKIDDRVVTPDPMDNWIDQNTGRNLRLGSQKLELDKKCLEIKNVNRSKTNACPVELKEQRSYLESSQNINSTAQYINTIINSLLNIRYPLNVDKLSAIRIFPSHIEGGFLFNGHIYANSRIKDFIDHVGYVKDPTFNVKDVILHELIHQLDHQGKTEISSMVSHNDSDFAKSIKSQLSNEIGRNIWDMSLEYGATYSSNNIADSLNEQVSSLHEALASELTALCGNGNKYRQLINNLENIYTEKYGKVTDREQFSKMKNIVTNRVKGISSGKIINSWYKYCWENNSLSTKIQ